MLPVVAPELGIDRYIELMKVDKKAEAGSIKFILLKKLGDTPLSPPCPTRTCARRCATRR